MDAVAVHLARAIEAAKEAGIGTVRSIAVDYQASGEYPFRITVADEDLPVVGLAYGEGLSAD